MELSSLKSKIYKQGLSVLEKQKNCSEKFLLFKEMELSRRKPKKLFY